MSSFFSWSDPHLQTLLLVQVIGFPLAFLIRAFRQACLSYRSRDEQRRMHGLKALGNLCFALTSVSCLIHLTLAAAIFALGVVLSFAAFRQTRALQMMQPALSA